MKPSACWNCFTAMVALLLLISLLRLANHSGCSGHFQESKINYFQTFPCELEITWISFARSSRAFGTSATRLRLTLPHGLPNRLLGH